MSGFVSKLVSAVALGLAVTAAPMAAQADITFDALPGANGSAFTGPYSEDGLSISATAGDVFVGTIYGNPVPSLFFGPNFGSSTASLEITSGGALFNFASFDFSANNGTAYYTVRGFANAAETFSLVGDSSIGGFVTIASGTNLQFDRVTFDFRVAGTSANFDNFIGDGGVVPEPATWALLIMGFGGVGATLRSRRRTPSAA